MDCCSVLLTNAAVDNHLPDHGGEDKVEHLAEGFVGEGLFVGAALEGLAGNFVVKSQELRAQHLFGKKEKLLEET